MKTFPRRRASFFIRFLAGFLIAGQLCWGPPSFADNLRAGQEAETHQAGVEAKLLAGMEQEAPMRPASQTRFRVEGMMSRTFDELDANYGRNLSGAIDEMIGQKPARPIRVLVIGAGRGNEAVGLKSRYGDAVEVWAVNRKEGVFYDRQAFEAGIASDSPEVRGKEIESFEHVRSRLRIVDIEKETPSFEEGVPGGFFDLVVFGNAVSIYFRDKVEVFNRLLERLVRKEGHLFLFADNMEFETPHRYAEQHLVRRNYLRELEGVNRGVVARAGEMGLRVRNNGRFRIPLELARVDEFEGPASSYVSVYRGLQPRLAAAGAEERTRVVIGRSVAEKFPGLDTLPGMEERFLMIDRGPETVVKLFEAGAEEVRYYGSTEEGRIFQAMTDGLLPVRLHSADEPGFLKQIERALSWAGVPQGMIAAGIEALAAGAEELRQAA